MKLAKWQSNRVLFAWNWRIATGFRPWKSKWIFNGTNKFHIIPKIDYIEWFLHWNQFFTKLSLFLSLKMKMKIMEWIIYRFIPAIVHSFKFKPVSPPNLLNLIVDAQNRYWHARQVLTWLCVYFKQMCNEFLNGSSRIAGTAQVHPIRVWHKYWIPRLMLCLSTYLTYWSIPLLDGENLLRICYFHYFRSVVVFWMDITSINDATKLFLLQK